MHTIQRRVSNAPTGVARGGSSSSAGNSYASASSPGVGGSVFARRSNGWKFQATVPVVLGRADKWAGVVGWRERVSVVESRMQTSLWSMAYDTTGAALLQPALL